MGMELWPDYLRFHELAVQTRDVDPVYPVMKRFLELNDVAPDSDAGYWLSVAHLSWYHIGSALRAWTSWDLATMEPTVTLPCATERRGNRDPLQLKRNLASWRDWASEEGGLRRFIAGGLPDDPKQAWTTVMDRIQLVHGNGRWASYKLAEILMKVNGLPLEPYHMGHANSSGPRRGMELLMDDLPAGNSVEEIRTMDALSEMFVEGMRTRGLQGAVEEVETSLCDFHALHDGRYYVGNDIDQMLEQLMGQPLGHWTDSALQARYDTLPHAYLGELGGWNRVDRDRQRAYRDTGEILQR